ncbi:MAG: hypothetical protein M3081_02300 [Gemmatimonadota bacterium]|nr:hypothetical protein [Gemmatimonadota bacterium]
MHDPISNYSSQPELPLTTVDAALDQVVGALSVYLETDQPSPLVSVEAAPVRDAARAFARVGRTAGLASGDLLGRLQRRLAERPARSHGRPPLYNAVATWAIIEYHRAE